MLNDFIRIDDYPLGDPTYLKRAPKEFFLNLLFKAIEIFESKKTKYYLGVTPMLINESDIARLNQEIKIGQVVMHGFNHGWDFQPWSDITKIWPNGGEFSRYSSFSEMQKRYRYCDQIMRKINRYNPKVHIPPFNCYNQSFVDVFRENGGELILSCDKEHNKYEHFNFDFKGVNVSLSNFEVSYCDVPVVINNLKKIDLSKEHITLHWMYDTTQNQNWVNDYKVLCDGFARKINGAL